MSLSLIPDTVFSDYRAVTAEFLRARGITLLLSDLDYTLAPKSRRLPDEEVRRWLSSLKSEGITVVVISNNHGGSRAKEFCVPLGVDFVPFAGKPSTRGLAEAMRRTGKTAKETAMLGDKLLTDVLAAKRMGIPALMVEPLDGPVGAWNRFLHVLQTPFKAVSRRRNEKNQKCGEKDLPNGEK